VRHHPIGNQLQLAIAIGANERRISELATSSVDAESRGDKPVCRLS
jgi:hypothetical protein